MKSMVWAGCYNDLDLVEGGSFNNLHSVSSDYTE